MARRPMLIISDNPLGNTGLGRVTGKIAGLIHETLADEFKVGVISLGSGTYRSEPYPIYPSERMGSYAPAALSYIWEEHCGQEDGILLTVMNAAWLHWLAFPASLPFGDLRWFLQNTNIQKWAYIPVDSHGPRGVLPPYEVEILRKMDRLLAYTKWGADVIDRSLGISDTPYLPHGTDSSIFYPRSKEEARKSQFCPRILKAKGSLRMDSLMLGCVATNTARKDWPLAFETCAELKARGYEVALWAHTNTLRAHWDLPSMIQMFDVVDNVALTFGDLSDEDMAWGYAACDATFGIGSGEGWGMPLSESLACNVPVITGDYAGATEFVPYHYLVYSHGWRYDGSFCNLRPVFRASDWADRVLWAKDNPIPLDPKYTWDGCWTNWEKWLKEKIA